MRSVKDTVMAVLVTINDQNVPEKYAVLPAEISVIKQKMSKIYKLIMLD